MKIPIPQNKSKPAKENLLRVDRFQGINIAVTDTQIQNNESPDMLNLNLDDNGALNKRYGQIEVLNAGTEPIQGLFRFTRLGGLKFETLNTVAVPSDGRHNASLLLSSAIVPFHSFEEYYSEYTIKKLCKVNDSYLGLTFDGRLMGMGPNTFGRVLVNESVGDTVPYPMPSNIAERFTDIAMSGTHVLGLMADGTVKAWGANTFKQLGLGTASAVELTPVTCLLPEPAVKIAVGYNSISFAIGESGQLYSWGRDVTGSLGRADSVANPEPSAVDGNTYTDISSANTQTCVLRSDGKLYSFGMNIDNGLCTGLAEGGADALVPTEVDFALPIKHFSIGYDRLMIVTTAGDLYMGGVIGNGGTGYVTPLQFTLPSPVKMVADDPLGDYSQGLVLLENGDLYYFDPHVDDGVPPNLYTLRDTGLNAYAISPYAIYTGTAPELMDIPSYELADDTEVVEHLLFVSGQILYRFNTDGMFHQAYIGMMDNDIHGFTYNDRFYMQTGYDYLVYDGVSVTDVVGYIPTVAIGSNPEGGGTPFEQLNLLSSGFKTRFTGDAAALVFQLPLTDLDTTPPIVYVDGALKVITADYSVDYTLGTITFVAPPSATIDGVEITAYKTFAGSRERIEKCRINTIYGGAGETRIFLSGNPEEANVDFRSGLLDPTYFPANGYANVGLPDEAITGYARQYSTLVIFKEQSQYLRSEVLPADATEPMYPIKRLNDVVGCVGFDQVQIIENYPVSIDKRGVYMTQSTQIADERNVVSISDLVNRRDNFLSTQGILDEADLTYYKTADHDKKYMMFNKRSGVVWVYDYQFQKWFKWDNIFANCFLELDGLFYYGDSRTGLISRFAVDSDLFPYRDFADPVVCYWRSKAFDFGSPMHTKLVNKLFYTIKPEAKTSTTLKLKTTRNTTWETIEESETINTLVYSLLGYSTMVYGGHTVFPIVTRTKLRAKKIGYLQLEFSNDKLDEGFGLLSIEMLYRYMAEQK